MAEAYCVKDKQKVEIVDPEKITMKNGKPAIKGKCPICGGSVFRIGAGRSRSRPRSGWPGSLAVPDVDRPGPRS